jgi:glycosyltransferase involved in cell wall biosynthesis
MKIAHVITRLVAGGAQRNTLVCALHQQQSGHQVVVISGTETSREGSLLAEARDADYRWIGVPAMVRSVRPDLDLQALLRLMGIFRAEKFDLVHTHTSKGGILGRLAAAVCGVPVVVHTPHGHVFHSYFTPWKARAFEVLERFCAPLADAMVMLSTGELADHRQARVVASGCNVVIPSGVALDAFRPLHCGSSPFTVGYVGRLADIKGPLDLVDAFSLHRQNYPTSRLLIVGDGPQRSEVEGRIQGHSLAAHVQMVGWQDDIREYLQQMNVLVVPSHNEGMGRVVVEAMAAGLAVLATSVGGLLDLVIPGFNGILVEPRSPQQLADRLDQLAQDSEFLRQLGHNGRSMADRFSQEVMLDRLDLLYERLCRQRGLASTTVPA